MTQSKRFVTAIALLLGAHVSHAQTIAAPPAAQDASPDPTPAPAPSIPTAWKVGQLNLSGMIDGYYDLGFNHPADHVNELLNFDDRANQLELNMASVTLDYAPDPVGFHLDAGVGRAFDIMSSTEKDATGASPIRTLRRKRSVSGASRTTRRQLSRHCKITSLPLPPGRTARSSIS